MLWPKKALAIDLDWIISLGIFLIYLGVFFIVIRQLPTNQSPASALLDNVLDNIAGSTKWSVQKLPLLIASNISGNEPVIVRFSQDWKNFSFTGNTSFDHADSWLVFSRNLREGKNLLEIVTSGDNYTAPLTNFDLTAGTEGASVDSQRFVSGFKTSMLARVNHFEKERLSDFNMSISGVALIPKAADAEANTTTLSARYKLSFAQLNHTAFIVAGYSRILNYVTTGAGEPHNLSVSATLRNYTFFHINNALSGTINYTSRQCVKSSSRYIDFYDSTSGVTFVLPEGANMSFCAGSDTVKLSADFSILNETRYDIIFHPGDFNSTLKYVSPYRTAFGMPENITGISQQLYRKLNETDYLALKRNFSYPSSRDFSFFLYNESGTLIFSYQPEPAGITNVFAQEATVFLLDKYGEKSKHTLRVRGW
ncbi:hypothetical protein HYU40_04255 [Candidatus Woesearchaeota archaeon]|nr:hypothetical protein [Candidatus Woesearchaeota archaeon]